MGQFYGLSFVSNEAIQDQRTGLDLSPKNRLCFDKNFQLSFDISFRPDQFEYFGYIFRLIDPENRNIDLISNINSPSKNHIIFINQGESIPHYFDLDDTDIFKSWNKFTFDYDLESQTLTYSFLGITSSQKIPFEQGSCFKILFGANDYSKFKTTDVPPMVVQNIEIHEHGNLIYQWLLDEQSGNIAAENIAGRSGDVLNPLWVKELRSEWRLLKKISSEGPVSVAFNSTDGLLYIVGVDSLISFSPSNNELTSLPNQSGSLQLQQGNQSYYDTTLKRLHNIYLDQGLVSTYSPETQAWTKNYTPPKRITDNWHFNKIFNSKDSTFYFFGGYGHFIYKNIVRKFHNPTGTWDSIAPPAESYTPRYLAALGGSAEGDIYLIGGYGTYTGQQIHNPSNLYDLLRFDPQDQTFKKMTELRIKDEDFVFANSMVIDQNARGYYGLIFSKHKFNSELQLIRGSLDSATYTEVGNKIPFKFYDINSFVDLYYSSKLEKFFAVTLFYTTDNYSEIAIYSISSPPIPILDTEKPSNIPSYAYILSILGILVLLFILIFYLNGRKKIENSGHIPILEITSTSITEIDSRRTVGEVQQNTMYLFGVFQLFDKSGNDITKNFTPLIRELFLLILLYSIRWKRGISSEKLKDLLWFDKSNVSARNNRSVNIAKLKSILSEVNGCEISKETGYWKANIDPTQINVDFFNYYNIIQDKKDLSKKRIKELIAIVQRGSFLSNLEYEWLDSFKSEIGNEIIDLYTHYANSINISDDPEFLIEIANHIFYFDLVNEEAMMLKCKSLVYLGKHSLAKGVFENFKKEYKNIYGEEFHKEFQTILE
ncbi:Kelch repeat-containing protein [Lunatibacter salilacus]|uniref:galactose oxidase n=1 Tax=Lunatibacter salilacus TaxID=2483804 RepID=UPI00131CE14E|nr:galactose oxidase [Lunatibacter salilacus]